MNAATARTFLFVPGHRPDRFAKAASSGTDVVVLDLEDAVGAGHKTDARHHVRTWLDEGHEAIVRINAPDTPWHEDDLTMLRDHTVPVMVPKAEDPARLDAIARRLPAGAGIIPLLETAAGIVRAMEVCAVASVLRPAFGSVDLAAQLGVDHRSHEALRHARSALVLAAAATSRPAPIDGVTTTLGDDTALRADLDHAITLGFTGKLCIHPQQTDAANRAFTPSPQDIEWAGGVLKAATDGSVAVYKGQMIDRPVLLRARAILARVRE